MSCHGWIANCCSTVVLIFSVLGRMLSLHLRSLIFMNAEFHYQGNRELFISITCFIGGEMG